MQWLQLVVKVGLMLPTGSHTQENYSEVKKGVLASHLNISFFKQSSLRCFSLRHSWVIIIASFIIDSP